MYFTKKNLTFFKTRGKGMRDPKPCQKNGKDVFQKYTGGFSIKLKPGVDKEINLCQMGTKKNSPSLIIIEEGEIQRSVSGFVGTIKRKSGTVPFGIHEDSISFIKELKLNGKVIWKKQNK